MTELEQDQADTHIPLEEHLYLMRSVKYMVWTFAIAFACMLGVGGFNVWYTNHVNNERIKAQEVGAAAGRRVTCTLINSQIKVWEDSPPTTNTSRKLQQSWVDMGKLLHCEEEK